MAEHRDTSTIFQRLMTLNREAFDAGHYHTAYHTLPAALYEAQEQQAAQDLATIQRVAEEQLAWIDHTAPAYEHSTPSAAARGHTSIFAMLARQAHARCLLLQEQDRRAGGLSSLTKGPSGESVRKERP
jgi:hypothetical protein